MRLLSVAKPTIGYHSPTLLLIPIHQNSKKRDLSEFTSERSLQQMWLSCGQTFIRTAAISSAPRIVRMRPIWSQAILEIEYPDPPFAKKYDVACLGLVHGRLQLRAMCEYDGTTWTLRRERQYIRRSVRPTCECRKRPASERGRSRHKAQRIFCKSSVAG